MDDAAGSFIKGFSIIILLWCFWILVDLTLFKKPSGSSSCGCKKKKVPDFQDRFLLANKQITEKDVTPEQKACIAIGVCTDIDTLGVHLIPEAKLGWQEKIMNSATKIFAENKPATKAAKKNTASKKGKRK